MLVRHPLPASARVTNKMRTREAFLENVAAPAAPVIGKPCSASDANQYCCCAPGPGAPWALAKVFIASAASNTGAPSDAVLTCNAV